jgi:hypothetical protein
MTGTGYQYPQTAAAGARAPAAAAGTTARPDGPGGPVAALCGRRAHRRRTATAPPVHPLEGTAVSTTSNSDTRPTPAVPGSGGPR